MEKDKINYIEKRLWALEQQVDEGLTEQTNSLTDIEPRMTNIETNFAELQTSLTNLSDSVGNNSQSISDLQTNVNNLQTTTGANTTNISNLSSNLASVVTNVSTLQTTTANNANNINTINSNIATLTNKVNVLETSSEEFLTKLSDFDALEKKIIEREDYKYNGGSKKVFINTKKSIGPYGYLFFRYNIGADAHFVGFLRLYFKDLPIDLTTTDFRLYLNGKALNLTNSDKIFTTNGEDYSLEIALNFYSNRVGNTLKIEFNDTNLANSVLTYMEIIATNAVNFMVLNRDESFNVLGYIKRATEEHIIHFNELRENGVRGGEMIDWTNYSSLTFNHSYQSSFSGEHIISQKFSYYVLWFSSLNAYTYYLDCYFDAQILGETNQLKYQNTQYTSVYSIATNVNSFTVAYLKGETEEPTILICLGNDQEIFYGRTLKNNSLGYFTLNNERLPLEFSQVVDIHDYWMFKRPQLFSKGFLAIHRSGSILFIPELNSSYLINIGVGFQPYAFIEQDGTTISVYYKGTNAVFKKQIKYNSTISKWELLDKVESFYSTVEIESVIDLYHNTSYTDRQFLWKRIGEQWSIMQP